MTITGASTLEDFSPGLRHPQAVRRGRLGVYSILSLLSFAWNEKIGDKQREGKYLWSTYRVYGLSLLMIAELRSVNNVDDSLTLVF